MCETVSSRQNTVTSPTLNLLCKSKNHLLRHLAEVIIETEVENLSSSTNETL